VVLMHSWQNSIHEIIVEDACKRAGFSQISVSHQVSPLAKLVGRGDTTVVDAYLSPILRRYVDRVAGVLGATPSGEPGPTLQFMMSSGGLTAADMFRGKDAILSGPAGGVVGMVETAAGAGFDKVIGFDMGGTSTDVATMRRLRARLRHRGRRRPHPRADDAHPHGRGRRRLDPAFRRRPVPVGPKAPAPTRPRLLPPRRAADGHRRQRHAGQAAARPILPCRLRPGQDQPLDVDAVRREVRRAGEGPGDGLGAEEIAEGFLPSPSRTWPTPSRRSRSSAAMTSPEIPLNCFGGAGGQHACLVADALGMESILIHPFSGLLSAYGIGLASVFASRQQALIKPLEEDSRTDVKLLIDVLCKGVFEELKSQGVPDDAISWRPMLQLRYDGTDTTIPVAFSNFDFAAARTDFETAHKAQFGFV
jgi:5-oxoprolinase (ATP-hydrolysing)